MSLKKREFTKKFKLKVVRAVEAGLSQAQAGRQFQVNPETISRWRKQHRKYKGQAFAGQGKSYAIIRGYCA